MKFLSLIFTGIISYNVFSCDQINGIFDSVSGENYITHKLIQHNKDQQQTIKLLTDNLESIQRQFKRNQEEIEAFFSIHSKQNKESTNNLEDIYNENCNLIQEIKQLKNQIVKLNQQNKLYKSQLQSNKKDISELENKQNQINTLKQENCLLNKQANRLKKTRQLQTVVLGIANDGNKPKKPTYLIKQLYTAREELSKLREQIRNYEQVIATYEQNNEDTTRYSHNLHMLQEQIIELKEILKAKDAELERLNQEKRHRQAHIPSIHDEAIIDKAYKTLENQHLELQEKYKLLYQNYLNLESEHIARQGAYEQSHTDHKQHEVNLNKQIKAMEIESIEFKSREKNLQQQLKKIKQSQAEQQIRFDETNKAHQNDIRDLEDGYKALQTISDEYIKRSQQDAKTAEAKIHELNQIIQCHYKTMLDLNSLTISLKEQALQSECSITNLTLLNAKLTADNKQHEDDRINLDEQIKTMQVELLLLKSHDKTVQQHLEKLQKLQAEQQNKFTETNKAHQNDIRDLEDGYKTLQATSNYLIKRLQQQVKTTELERDDEKQLVKDYQDKLQIKEQDLTNIIRAQIDDRKNFIKQQYVNTLKYSEHIKNYKEQIRIYNFATHCPSPDRPEDKHHLEIADLKSKLQKLTYENKYLHRLIVDLYSYIQEIHTKTFNFENNFMAYKFNQLKNPETFWNYPFHQINNKIPHALWIYTQL